MKKIMLLLMVIGLVLVFGISFAEEGMATAKGTMNDPDSLINYLDPSNAPVVKVPAHRGLLGLTEEGLPGAGGSAAGGMENPDSFINYLDPSNAPGTRFTGKAGVGVIRDNPDSIIHTLDPSQ